MRNTSQSGSRPAAEMLDADTERADGTARDPRIDHTDPGTQMRANVRRQREEFGGLNWGSAFFGWLVAVGIATLLTRGVQGCRVTSCPGSRAALADATNHRERDAADLRAYAHHREPRARERLIRNYLPLRPLRRRPIPLD